MASGESQEENKKDLTEEAFLKDLYLYMKKRNSPIEKIPHLGFKQIDLFVMYKTVKDLGGYHQVTSHQLWKQVYNTLGGNPKSTSAATCTRRHYEKILLPYECYVKGGQLRTVLLQPPLKRIHCDSFSEKNGSQRPLKHRHLPAPLQQSPSHPKVITLPVHYPRYYHPGYPLLSPYVPIASSAQGPPGQPVCQPQVPYLAQQPPRSTESVKQPLEHLRYLAEQYKSSSGLTEPLNLSVKISPVKTKSPVSSFTSPSSNKNPKFLNKPFPLYPDKMLSRDEGVECGEVKLEGASLDGPRTYPLNAREDGLATTSSDDPASAQTETKEFSRNTKGPMSTGTPKADSSAWPGREDVSTELPFPTREKTSEMEIQIPLSLLHDWVKMYRSSTAKPFPGQETNRRENVSNNPDIAPYNVALPGSPRDQDAEDMTPGNRNVPSPTPFPPNINNNFIMDPYRFSSYQSLSTCGIQKNLSSKCVHGSARWDQTDLRGMYDSKAANGSGGFKRDTQCAPIELKVNPSSFTARKDFTSPVSSANGEESEGAGNGSSAGVTLNSSPQLHFTMEEIVKLKKIISCSS